MASFASSATTCGARKHAWTKIILHYTTAVPKLVCSTDDLILTMTNAQLFKDRHKMKQAQLSILSHDLAQPVKIEIEPTFP